MSKFAILPPHELQDAFPWSLRAPTLELASNHLISSVALTGVLALQAGRLWVEQADSDDEDEEEFEEDEPQPEGHLDFRPEVPVESQAKGIPTS